MKTMKISDVVEIIHQELSRWDHHAVSTALENIVSDLTKAITFEELPTGSWFRYKDSIYFKRESGSYAEFVNQPQKKTHGSSHGMNFVGVVLQLI